MEITFYKINKKINSTKNPTVNASESITISGSLKKMTSYNRPSILIDRRSLPKLSNINAYNMLSINLSKKVYYFINDVNIINNDIFEVICTKDVLGTYKSDILASTQYIARAVEDNNGIIDPLYPVVSYETASALLGNDFYKESGDPTSPTFSGFWTVTLSGAYGDSSRAKIGTDNTYILPDNDTARAFFNEIFSSDFVAGFGIDPAEISENLMKTIYNPFQYIKNVLYFPGMPNPADRYEGDWHNSLIDMNYGYWLLTSKGLPIVNKGVFTHKMFVQSAIGKHPQTAARGKWVNLSPFTAIKMQAGPFGQFVLDNAYFFEQSHIVALIYVDISTGDSIMRVYGADRAYSADDDFSDLTAKAPALEAHANLAIPVSLSSMRNNPVDAITSGINIAASVYSGMSTGNLTTAGASLAGGGSSMLKSLTPGIISSGVTGSLVNAFAPHSFAINYEYQILSEENPTRFGRPINKIRQLSELTGYVKCADSVVDIPANREDLEKIKNYLDTGFFIE